MYKRQTDQAFGINETLDSLSCQSDRGGLGGVLLYCLGNKVDFDSAPRKCKECHENFLRNIFHHRLYVCPRFSKQREKIKSDYWYKFAKLLPLEEFKNYITRLNSSDLKKCLKLM